MTWAYIEGRNAPITDCHFVAQFKTLGTVRSKIEKLNGEIVKAIEANDMDAVVAFYDPGAVVMGNGIQTAVGEAGKLLGPQ